MIPTDDLSLFRSLYTIRRFEETVLGAFGSGVFSGTTHTYLGQEANAVAVLARIADGDTVCSNHRCHGHFLAYGGDPRALFAEMMGRVTGVCNGRGGSQHLLWRNFYANGILGGMVPIGTGMAMAAKRLGDGDLSVVFLGDGALGEGVVYESFNMASLWRLPILYVLENNHVAQATPTELELAGSMVDRFRAFGIACTHLDTSDVREILEVAAPLLDEVREEPGPRALVIDTWRFGPHSKGDDLRAVEHLEDIRATRDPVTIQGGCLDPATRLAVMEEVDAGIGHAFELASSDPAAEGLSAGELPDTRSLERAEFVDSSPGS
jgi:TPP-dependent pyruvate/acetoin dehydrogenase alpha subunit